MIIIGMPVQIAAGWFGHQATATGAAARRDRLLTLRHSLLPHRQQVNLHDTPDTTDFTEGDANFPEGSTARIPAFVGDSERATVPAASAPARLALTGGLAQEVAARLFRAGVTRIVGQVKQISQGERDFVRRRLQLRGGRRSHRWLLRLLRLVLRRRLRLLWILRRLPV